MALGAKRTQARVLAIAEELRARALPIIASSEDLIHDTVPKVKTITDNLLETSHIVRDEGEGVRCHADGRESAHEGADCTASMAMVENALTATGALAEMMHQSVRKPMVEVSGLVNGLKAGLNVLLRSRRALGRSTARSQRRVLVADLARTIIAVTSDGVLGQLRGRR